MKRKTLMFQWKKQKMIHEKNDEAQVQNDNTDEHKIYVTDVETVK